MKSPQKLDILLMELYYCGSDANYIFLTPLAQNAGIPLARPSTIRLLAKKLAKRGFIDMNNLSIEPKARITEEGIQFCESNSFAYEGYPIITHIPEIILENNLREWQ